MAAKPAQRRPSDLDLAVLAELEAAELRRLWLERRGVPAPPTLSGRLMRLALAWEIQADAEGGESSAVRRQWQTLMTRRAGGASLPVGRAAGRSRIGGAARTRSEWWDLTLRAGTTVNDRFGDPRRDTAPWQLRLRVHLSSCCNCIG